MKHLHSYHAEQSQSLSQQLWISLTSLLHSYLSSCVKCIIHFINIVLHGLHSNSYAFRHFAVERFSSEPCISLQAISLITTAFHYLHWPFHYGYDAWCAKQVYGWSEVIHCVYLISYVVVYICILCISDILRSCVYLYIVYIWYLTSLPKLNKNKNSHCELSRSPLQC